MSDKERAEQDMSWTRAERIYRTLGRAVAMLLGCGMLLVVLVGFVEPARMGLWGNSQLVTCKNNLSNIGKGLKVYATSNRSGLFPTLYSKAGDERAAKERWGGPDGWDEKTFRLKDRGKEGMELKDHEPFTCNLHCLWMLVRSGSLTPGILVCPSEKAAEAAKDGQPRSWWDFESLTQCSYSYQNQLGRATRDNVGAEVVLVADKSPMRPDVQTEAGVKAGKNKPKPDSDAAKWYTWNSPNHRWQGQNVLYGDGHVEFKETPACGRQGNNIWIGEDWDAETKAWKPADPPTYGRYDKGITARDDSWLVP